MINLNISQVLILSITINAATVLTIGIHDGLVQEFVFFHDDDFQAPLSHTKVFKST